MKTFALHTPARHPALRHEHSTRHQRPARRRASDGGDGRRGQARRRLAPDGLARDQRQHARAARDQAARARRDAPARLPPQPGGARARHRALGDARGRELRHHPVRARLDAVRDRAGRARGGLLHHHRQPPRPRPQLRAGRRRAPARPGRRRHPRHHAAGGRGRRARQPARRRPAGGGRGRPPQLGARWSPSTSSPGRSTPRSCCSTSATRPSWHVSGPREFLEAQQRVDGWRATLEAAGARVPPVLVGDWSPALGLPGRPAAGRGPRGDGHLRGQRPDGARRPARAARARPRDPARGEHRRLRRHPRGAVLHAAADHRAPGLRRDGAQQPAPAARAHAGHRASRLSG